MMGTAVGDAPKVLAQSPQNYIPAKLASWRTRHHLGLGSTLDDAARADPEGWLHVESELVAVVIGQDLLLPVVLYLATGVVLVVP